MQKNQLKTGIILTYINLFATNILSLFYTPFILHSLGKAEYGVYTLVWSMVNYLTVLDLGFSNAIIRYGARYREENEKEKEAGLYGSFFLVYLGIAMVALIVCFLLKVNVSSFAAGLTFSETKKAMSLIMIGSINIAISFPFSVFRAIVNVNEDFIFIKVVDLLRTLTTPVSTFLVLASGHSSVGLMWVYTIISIAVMLIYVYYTFAKLRQRFLFQMPAKNIIKELSEYSFYTFLGMIVDKIYWGTDQLILSRYTDSSSIAVYSIGSNFPNYFISFSTAISGVLLPRITKITAKKDTKTDIILSGWFIKVGRLQFWMLSLVLLGFVFFGKQFIGLWAGIGYSDAYIIAVIIMFPSIISLTQNTGISILQAQNKIKFRSISYVIIAIFNIIISLSLVIPFGGVGCAIGTSMGTILGPILMMNIYYYKKIHIDIPAYWRNLLSMLKAWMIPIVVGGLMAGFIKMDSYVPLITTAIGFTCVYFVSAYWLGFNDYERSLVKVVCRKFIKK